MKKFIAVIGIVGSLMSPAYADSTIVKGTITDVWPVMSNVTQNVADKQCRTVEVPIYGNGGKEFDQGGAIIGGIIGGVIGNQIGKGGGNDVATGVGAVAGTIIGGQKTSQQQIVGYRQERQCSTVYTPVTTTTITGYNFEYNVGRLQGQKGFSKREVFVGQTVKVRVHTNVVW